MGAKGQVWMMREFSWQRVARDMLDVYRWLLHRSHQHPTPVRFF
jgi:hypothetical protein